jgi:hypothetical protein
LRSADTLENIGELGEAVLYRRLALWLLDAPVDEIAAYWKQYSASGNRRPEITRLIMVAWTRLDPVGATKEAKGAMGDAWRAWSAHDPRAALEAAQTTAPDYLVQVAWGIGEFHPDWLREHFDEIPASVRDQALTGLAQWGECADPEATLDFLVEKGRRPSPEILGHFTRRDPLGAFDWVMENREKFEDSSNVFGSDAVYTLVHTMAETRPEILEQLAAQTPSGEMKRKMEAAVFENLLDRDLDAALDMAEATQAPKVAPARLAEAGLRLLGRDPDRALAVARELFTRFPDATDHYDYVQIEYADGSGMGFGGGANKPQEFLGALLKTHPAALLDLLEKSGRQEEPGMSSLIYQMAWRWSMLDPGSVARWIDEPNAPKARNRIARPLYAQFQVEQQFEKAADWAARVDRHPELHVLQVLRDWRGVDPGKVRSWLENTDLPEEAKQQLRTELESRQ